MSNYTPPKDPGFMRDRYIPDLYYAIESCVKDHLTYTMKGQQYTITVKSNPLYIEPKDIDGNHESKEEKVIITLTTINYKSIMKFLLERKKRNRQALL